MVQYTWREQKGMATAFEDYEISEQYKNLAVKIAQKRNDLRWLVDNDHFDDIVFVISYAPKKNKSSTFADTRKVKGSYKAFCPYALIVTIYEPVASMLSDNQIKILLYHELLHIGHNGECYILQEHDVQDFYRLLKKYGVDWSRPGNDNVPDILQPDDEDDDEDEDEG